VTIPLVTQLGRMTLALLATIGAVSAFAWQALRRTVQPPYYRRQILRQMLEIGYYSLPVVGLTAIFTGMVLALQSYTGFARFSAARSLRDTIDFVRFQDVLSGLVTAAVVGFLITLMGCYHGYTSKGGAQGVGIATTNAVVSASILILTANYFITEAFFAL